VYYTESISDDKKLTFLFDNLCPDTTRGTKWLFVVEEANRKCK